jgi:riboflavin biosynthesis pyrimidine reductase
VSAAPTFEVLSGADGGEPLAAEVPYGGPLRFPASPRPYVITNFVATVDGVVSLGISDGTDSSAVSGASGADRYLMALLRATSDAVLIGAGTLRATPGHQWIPAAVAGDQADAIAVYRAERTGSAVPAPLVIVSASGDLPAHVALDQPATAVAVITSGAGAVRVRAAHPSVTAIEAGDDQGISAGALLGAVARLAGPGVLLCEGGPSLFGRLVAAHAANELFLTVSPRISGREHDQTRPGIITGWAADPRALREATLDSVRRSGDHLFLRYRLES